MSFRVRGGQRAFLLFLLLLLAGGGLVWLVGRLMDPAGRDLQVGTAPSPGGRVLAQLWCMGACPDQRNVVLTISWTGSLSGRLHELTGRGVFADAPDRDVVARFSYRGDRPALHWETAKLLAVHGSCLIDEDGKPIADTETSAAHVSFRERRSPEACAAEDRI